MSPTDLRYRTSVSNMPAVFSPFFLCAVGPCRCVLDAEGGVIRQRVAKVAPCGPRYGLVGYGIPTYLLLPNPWGGGGEEREILWTSSMFMMSSRVDTLREAA